VEQSSSSYIVNAVALFITSLTSKKN